MRTNQPTQEQIENTIINIEKEDGVRFSFLIKASMRFHLYKFWQKAQDEARKEILKEIDKLIEEKNEDYFYAPTTIELQLLKQSIQNQGEKK
jgi:hypothetical protein